MVNEKEHGNFLRTKLRLVLHHHRARQHVVEAAFAVCESNHDETDAEKHGRQYLGKKPPCSATKANLIASFIYYFKA